MAASRSKKRKGINPGKPPGESRIDPGSPPPDQTITFSFKYLHPNPPVSQEFPEGYFAELLRCLQHHSRQFKSELVGSRNPAEKAHGINWATSNVPQGFDHLPKQLREMNGYQLSVKREEFGRIVGLLLENVFYVCWFDPQHETTGRQK